MTLQHQKDTQGEASLRINEVGSGVRRSDRIQDLATQMALLGVVENIQSVVLDTLRASHSPIDATIGGALNTSVTEGSTLVSSEELYSRVVANLEASKSQILSKLSEKWQSSTTQFLEQFHDDGLAERGCAACSQLNQSIEPSSALYSSGISSIEQQTLDKLTVNRGDCQSWFGDLGSLYHNVSTFLEDVGIPDGEGRRLAALTICKRVASFIGAEESETGIVLCSTFKPENEPIEASSWHVDGNFDPAKVETDELEKKAVSTVFGEGTDTYADPLVDRDLLVEYTETITASFHRKSELDELKNTKGLNSKEELELESIEMAVQDVESRFLASIDTESVEQVGAGDVLVILSGDPRHGALHRVPEITKDRLFLQIYALSSESTAEVMWMDQMRRVGEVFRAAT